ncbi:uncharacterized protein isoform X2 [Rhodnius prolixus]|uniref:uncharacterized protein isoform X2 n=1 Tax=Rhodnius prolixus TaxID=13249 RepID=UPI003D188686
MKQIVIITFLVISTKSIYPITDYGFNKRQFDPTAQDISDQLDRNALAVEREQKRLQSALQWLYQAQAAEKWEEESIQRTEQVADDARDDLDKATDDVRMKSADLQRAREKASRAASKARKAIVSLSAHDQLMNRARQLIYELTAQVIMIQSQLLEVQQKYIFNDSSTPLEDTDPYALKKANLSNEYRQLIGEPPDLNQNYIDWIRPSISANRLINNNYLIPQKKMQQYDVRMAPIPASRVVGYVNKCPITMAQQDPSPLFIPVAENCYCAQPFTINKPFISWQKK